MNDVKTCRDCGLTKPITEFSPLRRNRPDGPRKGYCRPCYRERNRVVKQRMRATPSLKLAPVDAEPKVWVPAGPLAVAMDRRIKRCDFEDCAGVLSAQEAVCQACGVDPRRLSAWRTGESERTTLDLADRVLIGLDLLWFDVWDPARFPEVQAVFEPVEQLDALVPAPVFTQLRLVA